MFIFSNLSSTHQLAMPPIRFGRCQEQVVFGENGHAEIAPQAFGNTMLAFFDKLGRGLPEHSIRQYIKDILLEDEKEHNEDQSLRVKNLFLLVFRADRHTQENTPGLNLTCFQVK